MTKRVEKPEAEEPEVALEFELSSPINAYGEEIKLLKLRKPTGLDIVAVGNPVPVNPYVDPPEVHHDYKRVVQMVARLANVPSSSLEKLNAGDMVKLGWAIAPFFL